MHNPLAGPCIHAYGEVKSHTAELERARHHELVGSERSNPSPTRFESGMARIGAVKGMRGVREIRHRSRDQQRLWNDIDNTIETVQRIQSWSTMPARSLTGTFEDSGELILLHPRPNTGQAQRTFHKINRKALGGPRPATSRTMVSWRHPRRSRSGCVQSVPPIAVTLGLIRQKRMREALVSLRFGKGPGGTWCS